MDLVGCSPLKIRDLTSDLIILQFGLARVKHFDSSLRFRIPVFSSPIDYDSEKIALIDRSVARFFAMSTSSFFDFSEPKPILPIWICN